MISSLTWYVMTTVGGPALSSSGADMEISVMRTCSSSTSSFSATAAMKASWNSSEWASSGVTPAMG